MGGFPAAMMTKQQVIDATLQAMHQAYGFSDECDAIVMATLNERLPDREFKTCEDLSLGVECCDSCHTFYPHYDMYLETLPNGELAWLCCRVRSALRNPGQSDEEQDQEWIDLEEALGGGLRTRNQNREEGEGK